MDVLFVLATVAVAQLVEPWIVIPVVDGSSPFSHPSTKPAIDMGGFFIAFIFFWLLCFARSCCLKFVSRLNMDGRE